MSSPILEPTPLRAARTDASNRGTKARPRYRACLVCSYVQPSPDWVVRGCPNCEAIVRVAGSMDQVKACTSIQFDGVIAVLKPKESWVARWQRNVNHVPGLYAVRVIGRPPPEIIARIKRSGVPYIPRDDVAGDHTKQDEDEDDLDGDEDGQGYDDEDNDGRGGRGRALAEDQDEYEKDGMIVDDDEEDENDENNQANDWRKKNAGAGRQRGAGGDDGLRGELSEDDDDEDFEN